MKQRVFLLCCACLVFAGPAFASAPATVAVGSIHPLMWGRTIDLNDLDGYDEATLFEAAEWLNNWGKMVDRAPTEGNFNTYLEATRKAKEIYEYLSRRNPENSKYMAGVASAMYNIGELLPEEEQDSRLQRYETMIDLMNSCVKDVDPRNAVCWTLLGAAYGRLGTTRGILSSAFLARKVEGAWEESLEIASGHISLNGDPITIDTQYGLAIFYRMVPDHWLVKIITGTRGDKERSVASLRQLTKWQPQRLELQKELAVSLLCHGDEEDDESVIREGRVILERILAGEFERQDVRMTDRVDKKHASELLQGPPQRACGYSRDGFEDLSREALEEAKQKHQK